MLFKWKHCAVVVVGQLQMSDVIVFVLAPIVCKMLVLFFSCFFPLLGLL